MFKAPAWADSKNDEQIVDGMAKILRGILNESVDYGYDAINRIYFFNVPAYNKSVDFLEKFLRERRWDILYRAMEILIEAINEEKEKGAK
jgi:hypothetical protein